MIKANANWLKIEAFNYETQQANEKRRNEKQLRGN